MMKQVLVCGSRDWSDREAVRDLLRVLQSEGYGTVIEGECRGADTIAREESLLVGLKVLRFPAKWRLYGRAAGPIRNRVMLDLRPDLVVAFHSDLSRSRGTIDTVGEARRRGIRVLVVE